MNLRKALELRSKEQYKEGLTYLEKACDESDGVALGMMGMAYLWGGWGVNTDDGVGTKYVEKAFDAGYTAVASFHLFYVCDEQKDEFYRAIEQDDFNRVYAFSKKDVCAGPLEIALFVSNTGALNFDLTHLIVLNDAYVNYLIAQCKQYNDLRVNLLKKSADQGFSFAIYQYIDELYERKDFDLAAPYAIRLGIEEIENCIKRTVDHCPARLRELYLYGEYYVKTSLEADCCYLYKLTKIHFERALLTWWLIAKRMRLYPDLRRLISKYLLKTAKDPSVWFTTSKPIYKKIKR